MNCSRCKYLVARYIDYRVCFVRVALDGARLYVCSLLIAAVCVCRGAVRLSSTLGSGHTSLNLVVSELSNTRQKHKDLLKAQTTGYNAHCEHLGRHTHIHINGSRTYKKNSISLPSNDAQISAASDV